MFGWLMGQQVKYYLPAFQTADTSPFLVHCSLVLLTVQYWEHTLSELNPSTTKASNIIWVNLWVKGSPCSYLSLFSKIILVYTPITCIQMASFSLNRNDTICTRSIVIRFMLSCRAFSRMNIFNTTISNSLPEQCLHCIYSRAAETERPMACFGSKRPLWLVGLLLSDWVGDPLCCVSDVAFNCFHSNFPDTCTFTLQCVKAYCTTKAQTRAAAPHLSIVRICLNNNPPLSPKILLLPLRSRWQHLHPGSTIAGDAVNFPCSSLPS